MEFFEELIEALINNDPSLTKLIIDSEDFDETQLKVLFAALKTNKIVQQLRMRDIKIGNDGAKALVDVLKINTTIHLLSLSNNDMTETATKSLFDALQHNTTLESCMFDRNEISDIAAQALANVLKSNKTLSALDMTYTNISNEGVKALSDALKNNTTLTILFLLNNNISDEGANALGDMLKNNTTLITLFLSYNNIGYRGAIALADALKQNKTLQRLYIEHNNITDDGVQALAQALVQNTVLNMLIIFCNIFDEVTKQALINTLQQNVGLTHSIHVNIPQHYERNRRLRSVARHRAVKAALALMMIRNRRVGYLASMDKLLVRAIAKQMVNNVYIDIFQWLTPQEHPRGTYGVVVDVQGDPKRRKQNIDSCVACSNENPVYCENNNESHRFCGSYCQTIHYCGVPDIRGMTPMQIEIAFA